MINLDKLLSGDRRTLGKAITLIESSRPEDKVEAQKILKEILPNTGTSFRIGITGTPGVGKSSYIEMLGLDLIKKGHKVAVLAIDPSSPISGGSILGDKTRMELLSREENAFIRPSPSKCYLGGVAQKTRESILLCEAAGFDYIIIETVGVGQSETEVSNMTDFFMVLTLPNSGDEIQGIKKGILEIADLIIINKADGEAINQANLSKAQMENVLELFRHESHWKTEVLLSSIKNLQLINETFKAIELYKTKCSKYYFQNRTSQQLYWFENLLNELIKNKIESNATLSSLKNKQVKNILNNKNTPIEAAETLINEIFK